MVYEIVKRGVVMIKKIPFANNLTDLFAKTLTRRVFDGHKDNIGVRFVPSML